MSFLKNKHSVIAMITAPVLAIIAYFCTDLLVAETPHAAKIGDSYRLAAKSNCRYQSGVCTLKNGDIELQLRATRLDKELISLSLISKNSVEKVLVSFSGMENNPPLQMQVDKLDSNKWRSQLRLIDPRQSQLRLAANIGGVHYYAETDAVFVDFTTGFSRANFSQN